MKTLILITALFTGLIVEKMHSQPVTNWSNGECDAQLSIKSDTNVVAIGSTIILSIQVKNLSTNYSYIIESFPISHSSVYLTNSSGYFHKFNHLRSPSWEQSLGGPSGAVIKSGETYSWTLGLEIDKDIPPGSYELKATRIIFTAPPYVINHKDCELESNSLKVQIK